MHCCIHCPYYNSVLTLPHHVNINDNQCVPKSFSPGRHNWCWQFLDQVCLIDHPGIILSQIIFMDHLNNFKIIAGIQNFTALLKIKYILLPVKHLKGVKCAVKVILCVTLYIDMQIRFPKEPSLFDHFQKADNCIFLVLTTTVVKNNRNFRHMIVFIVWLRI